MKSRINVYLNNEIEKLAFLEKYEFLLPWEGGTNIREFNPISTRGTLNAPPPRRENRLGCIQNTLNAMKI